MAEVSWYELVKGTSDLEQGDILVRFPIVEIDSSTVKKLPNLKMGTKLKPQTYPVYFYDVILMTQSCDLGDAQDDDPVVLCSILPFTNLYPPESKKSSDMWGHLKRGVKIGQHLLNKCDLKYRSKDYSFDYQVVELRHLFNVQFKTVKAIAKQHQRRVRLNSPYKEHLAQAFARQFMRVGLPLDLPSTFPYPAPAKTKP